MGSCWREERKRQKEACAQGTWPAGLGHGRQQKGVIVLGRNGVSKNACDGSSGDMGICDTSEIRFPQRARA